MLDTINLSVISRILYIHFCNLNPFLPNVQIKLLLLLHGWFEITAKIIAKLSSVNRPLEFTQQLANITIGVLIGFTPASTDEQLLLPWERRNTSKAASRLGVQVRHLGTDTNVNVAF